MKSTAKPKYVRLKDKLKAMILNDELPADTRLPSQHELIKSEKLSYATISRVLNDLVDERLIYRIQGRGTFVAPHSERNQRKRSRLVVKMVIPIRLEDEGLSVIDRNQSAAIMNGAIAAQKQFDCDIETVYIDPRILHSTTDVLRAIQCRDHTGVFCFNYRGFEKAVACFKERNIPYLVHGPMDCLDRDINCIVVNVKSGARLAVEALIRAGRVPVAMVLNNSPWAEPKLDGYRQALKNAGLPVAAELEIGADSTEESAYRAFIGFLEQHRDCRPAAVFAGTDVMAFGVIRAIRERGLRVPEDVAVVGYDDIPQAAEFDPPLTTMRYDRFAIGRESVRLLLKLIREPELQPIAKIMRSEIVVRRTFATASSS